MALVVKTLPGVYGGVSNQSESLRKDNQVSEMVNCIPNLVLGTTRRPVVEQGVVEVSSNASFIYDYRRSTGESHILSVTLDGVIEAHTVGEGSKDVTQTSEVTAYLKHNNPDDLSGITIGDTTYLVNSQKVVGISQVATEDMPELDELYRTSAGKVEVKAENIAYYWLRRSSNDPDHPYRYVVELNGSKYSADSDKSDEAASSLRDTINDLDGWSAEVQGSIIKIYKDNYGDFSFNYWDSWGSMASFGWKYDVPKLQDLPNSFPWDGAVARVNSSDGSKQTDYYVIRWRGTWQEYTNRATYVADGNNYHRYLPLLNNLPIIVVRKEDGSFEARTLNTSDQLLPPLVGNADNNKDPHFVGKTIKQLFYINGRLCVASGDSLVFSEVDVLWNFFATTIINVLDSDTLEVRIASERVLEILKVAIFQSGLLIMTSEGQYLFNTENGISPATIIINKLSNYSYNNAGGTIYDGDSIVFSGTTGDTSRLYRYRVARLTSENKAIDLTIQVPTYIQGVVKQIASFVEDGTLIVRVEGSRSIYLYKEVISGDQMVQSSWFKWDFSNILDNPIKHIMVINSYLYFVSIDGVFKIPLGAKVFEGAYQHLDLGEVPYTSLIELTRWRPKKTNAQIQTTRGRIQLRAFGASMEGKAKLSINKVDRGLVLYRELIDKRPVNVLSDTDKTILSITNDDDKPFTINAITLSGTYREKGKEIV